MTPARIAELLEPFLNTCHSEPANAGEEPAVLSPAQLHNISTYIDLLLRWNQRVNLTAIRDPEDIVTRHFGESLFAARILFPNGTPEETAADCPSVADLGSGAGFPGLPIKLWAPQVHLTLIESNHKKATFLREIVRALTLTDVNIQNARAESLAETTYNLVTLRAVEHFEAILPVAASLVAPTGRLALLIGSTQLDTARSNLPTLSWAAPEPIPLSRTRVLAIAYRPAEAGSIVEPQM